MYKQAVAILSVSFLVFSLSGCGGASTQSVSTPTGPTSPVVSTANEWDWVSGISYISTGAGVGGTYGTVGMAATANVPGSRGTGGQWADSAGNIWIFGGYGLVNSAATIGLLNDVWRYSPTSNQWTWVAGSNTSNPAAIYGTLGAAGAASTPGGRSNFLSWRDANGNFWMFGGSNGSSSLNDLWMFSPTTNMWTWEAGTQTAYARGVYGTQGTASPANIPSARENGLTWTDPSDRLWLFGGYGVDGTGSTNDLNDLWVFDPKTKQWTWMGGMSSGQNPGVYRTVGVAASGNMPGARESSVGWVDAGGNFWMFGGFGYDQAGNRLLLNDLWELIPGTLTWKWVTGSSTGNAAGSYGAVGVAAAANVPGARSGAVGWADRSGNFYLLGGGGLDSAGVKGTMNDFWSFNTQTSQWKWNAGSSMGGSTGTYGMQGVAAATNIPSDRGGAFATTDSNGNFWLFGGFAASSTIALNDLWRYQPQ